MKYKHIPSMAHNFGHSFVSLMNYVGEAHIVDEIRRVIAQFHEPLHINFLDGTIIPNTARTDLLVASVRIYQSSFAQHALSHDVDPSSIHQLELAITRTSTGIEAMIQVQDDRGKQYHLPIAQTAL